jgi:YHS domain-containing protein
VTDPVCGMRLSGSEARAPAGRVGFCSERCEGLFRAQPELYPENG